MFKRLFLLVVILFIQFGFLPKVALAVGSCQDSGFDWNPMIFEENAPSYDLTFTINSINTLNFLKNHAVTLLVDPTWLPTGGYVAGTGVYTPLHGVNVQDKIFTIPLTGSFLTKAGVHYGVLRYLPTGASDYVDVCSNVGYRVGVVGKCNIGFESVPGSIPPNTTLTVCFTGKANTNYLLAVGNQTTLNILSTIENLPDVPLLWSQVELLTAAKTIIATLRTISSTPTDKSGQGTFPITTIPGVNGDKQRLVVYNSIDDIQELCSADIDININAQPYKPVTSCSVQIAPPIVIKKCGEVGVHCPPSGGDICDETGTRGPAIKTAIGCIHTNPNEFVKDLLTFIIAIGGGLAFLMMLLGAFEMITSNGNPESLANGRSRLTSAVIGLLFIIFAVLLMQIIGVGLLALPEFLSK